MKINQIYITKEGEPMANPKMEYPVAPRKRKNSFGVTPTYLRDVEKYHSGLLPFEDREKVKGEVFFQKTGGLQVDDQLNIAFKPDTIIPVDLEVEVVEQHRINEGEWIPGILTQDPVNRTDAYEYRQALRIKP